ncbi:MAG TPA: hypothetical protein VD905_14950 [Flavobacteriales bacterium]|nr:hypothetical protein [Flavobacteriales bacterium]
MNKLCIILFLLSFGGHFVLSAQTADEYEYTVKKKKVSTRKKNRAAVKKAIKQLKEGGAVIYIVKDRKLKSGAMKEKGLEEKAVRLETERMNKQKIIVQGIAKNFTFCPVYFMFQSDLDKLIKGEMAGNFLDTTLQKKPSIAFSHSYFLLLDYGDVYDEPGKVYCDTCKSDLTGRTSLKTDCFVFKNKYLSQLTKPFPYFITCHYPAKEISVKMRTLSKRLSVFYNKAAE